MLQISNIANYHPKGYHVTCSQLPKMFLSLDPTRKRDWVLVILGSKRDCPSTQIQELALLQHMPLVLKATLRSPLYNEHYLQD